MKVDRSCDATVVADLYDALKSIYQTFDYAVTCNVADGRILQSQNESASNNTAETSEVTAQVCSDGSCSDPAGSSEPSTNNLVAIIVPCVLVGLVAIITAMYVVKKRRAMRKQRDGVIYHPPKERKKRFAFSLKGLKKTSGSRRPRVLLKRSKDKKDSATDSVVTPSGEKDSESFAFGGSPTEEGGGTKEENMAEQSSGYFPQESANGTSWQGQDASFAQSSSSQNFEKANDTASSGQGSSGKSQNGEVEVHVESPTNEKTSSQVEEVTTKPTKSSPEKKASSMAKTSSSSKSKKNLTKVQCEKCSATFYSASGKTKCLKCRDDKRKKACEKCGAAFISVSGKSTHCTNCRKASSTSKQNSGASTTAEVKSSSD